MARPQPKTEQLTGAVLSCTGGDGAAWGRLLPPLTRWHLERDGMRVAEEGFGSSPRLGDLPSVYECACLIEWAVGAKVEAEARQTRMNMRFTEHPTHTRREGKTNSVSPGRFL